MEEIFSLPPLGAFDNNYQMVLEFMETLGNPKFKIAGDVYLENSDIESLGNLVEVEGELDLTNSNITSLPDNLKVGEDLSIYNTFVTSLPDNLHVGGNLFASETKITSIPNNLCIDYGLFIYGTPLSYNYKSSYKILELIERKGGYVGESIHPEK